MLQPHARMNTHTYTQTFTWLGKSPTPSNLFDSFCQYLQLLFFVKKKNIKLYMDERKISPLYKKKDIST